MKELLWAYLAAINLVGLLLFGADKQKARRNQRRISEKTLFVTVWLGGGLGAWTGMYLFHHKTKHWYFVIFIPLIALAEYLLLAWAVLR